MRRIMLAILITALAALVAARAMLAAPRAAEAAAVWDSERYNVLDLTLPSASETAGSAIVAEMDCYYLSRTPTAKNDLTGSLSGRNLVLILAENWKIGQIDEMTAPALCRLRSEGAQFAQVYAPEWYQQLDGREFALLSGITPTAVRDRTAFAWAGEMDVYLPFALARCLSGAGYTCRAWPDGEGRETSYMALGFSAVETGRDDPATLLDELSRSGPFFAYFVWPESDGEAALERLWQCLGERGLTENTALCLVTGHADPMQGNIFLWASGLEGADPVGPCSELDVTPTLLNLYGAAYDARFLSGRDVFAAGEGGISDAMPLVSLYGSAYTDWVTDRGSYSARDGAFFSTDGRLGKGQETARYVQQVRRLAYDRYAYARQVMENNYFRVVMSR